MAPAWWNARRRCIEVRCEIVHPQPRRFRAPSSAGFTLIELLIIVSMLGILAAMVFPMISTSSDTARTEALASNLSHVRAVITYHSGLGDVPMSSGGAPLTVDPAWFPGAHLPEHAWTGDRMIVHTVSLGADVVYPAVKTFNPLAAGADSAWYNSTNGAFCALVPSMANDAATVALFNGVNKVTATTLAQTTN